MARGMTYFTQQPTDEIGIGKTISFATEQHPKKRENKIGMLTMHVYKHDAEMTEPTKMMIKCSKVDPFLTGIISKEYAVMKTHKEALHKHINAYLCKQYGSTWTKLENNITSLSDSLYVLGIQMMADESNGGESGEIKPLFSAWEGQDGETKSVAKKAVAIVKKGIAKLSTESQTKKGMNVGREGTGPKAKTSTVAPTYIRKTGTVLDIKFARVEDVPMIMQACRVFFRNIQLSGSRPEVAFARGEMPMWWKYANEPHFDFKKTRDTYDNIEVTEQIRLRRGIHFFSCFTVAADNITFSTRVKSVDGEVWIPVIYVDFPNLVVLDRHILLKTME